ncbi:MAG: hypothetical protein RL582_1543 [Bacteroidota bacterium]|jgi:hypothetical protein
MSHPSPSNGKSICYYSNQVVLASNHVEHYMNLLKIDNINKSSEMFIEFAAQKKKIRLSFGSDGNSAETETQAIEMARMYLMHRIMYWKSLN